MRRSTLIGVGERQVRRLLKGYRERGVRSVVHGNRGRRPAHAAGPAGDTGLASSSMAPPTATDHFAATIAAGAAQGMLDNATFVITVRRLKSGETIRIEPSRW